MCSSDLTRYPDVEHNDIKEFYKNFYNKDIYISNVDLIHYLEKYNEDNNISKHPEPFYDEIYRVIDQLCKYISLSAADLEKDNLKKYEIPTAKFEIYNDKEKANSFFKNRVIFIILCFTIIVSVISITICIFYEIESEHH